MKSTLKILTLVITLFALSCGGGEEKKEEKTKVQLKKQTTTKKVEPKTTDAKPSETIDLTNIPIGTYFIRGTTGEKTLFTSKLVVLK